MHPGEVLRNEFLTPMETCCAPRDVSATNGKLLCRRLVERLAAGKVGIGPTAGGRPVGPQSGPGPGDTSGT